MLRQRTLARTVLMVASTLVFATAALAQDVPQLVTPPGRQLNPVPGEGEERGALPFYFSQVAYFSRVPYLFVGRGNRYDIFKMSTPTSPQQVASLTGTVPMVETADWDFHMRGLGVIDSDAHVFAPYYDLGAASQLLSSASAPTSASTVKTYPINATVSKPAQFVLDAAVFLDSAGSRYVIGRFLTGYDKLPLGVYSFADDGTVTRLYDLPLGGDTSAGTDQRFMTFEVPLSIGGDVWYALVPATTAPYGYWLVNLANASNPTAVTASQVGEPEAGYDSLLAYSYDPVKHQLALAFSNGQSILVQVLDFSTGTRTQVARAVATGAIPDSSTSIGIRNGVVALTSLYGNSSTRTTLLASVVSSTTSLVWQHFTQLDSTSPFITVGGTNYVALWNQTEVFGSDPVVVYRAGLDASEFWQVSRSVVDPSPHADFTVTDDTSSGAACQTGADVAANGYPGDSFTIHDASSGTVASATYSIADASGNTIVNPTTLPVGGTAGWSTRIDASTVRAPGKYTITVTATDSTNILTDTVSKSVWLCPESVTLSSNPTSLDALLGATYSFTATATGSPNGSPEFVYEAPGGAISATSTVSPFDVTLDQDCGTYTVGVVATYEYDGTNETQCSNVPGFAEAYGSDPHYHACDVETVNAAATHPEVTVSQETITLGAFTASASVSPLTVRDTTLAWSGQVSSTLSGSTLGYDWNIDNPAVCAALGFSDALPCDATDSSMTIPADTLTEGTAVHVTLTVTLTPGPTGSCQQPAPITITLNPANVAADLSIAPASADIGGQIIFSAANIQGSFSSFRVTFSTDGSAETCTGATGATLSGTSTTATFSTPGIFTATLYGTPSAGGSELQLSQNRFTVNSTGQCALPVALSLSSTTVTAPGSTTLFFNPPINGTSADSVVINWGDGASTSYAGTAWSLAPTLSSYAHTYTNTSGSAVTRTITVTGTVGGVPLAPTPTSLSVTVNPGTTPPAGGSLTLTWLPTSPAANTQVTFTFSPALSSSGDYLTFNFGDGTSQRVTPDSCGSGGIFGGGGTCNQVTHTYTTSGTKTVTASGTISSAAYSTTKTLTVTSACTATAKPGASFTFSPSAPQVGQAITFTDTSSNGPTSWAWDFGDGSPPLIPGGTSTQQNPAYTYQAKGTYTVTLIATNCQGSTTTTRQVTVKPACSESAPPTAAFDWSPKGTLDFQGVQQQQPFVGQEVTLTDESTNNPTSWHWYDFQQVPGASFTDQNPTFTWTTPGGKNVRLQATNCAGTSAELLQTVTIYPDIRPVTADFSWEAGGGTGAITTGSVVTFTASSGFDYGSPTQFVWDFGDGTSGSGATVTHTYDCRGTYTVTLVAKRDSYVSEPAAKAIQVDGDACAPEALIASGAAKTAGLNGTSWRTTMWVFNPADENTMVWLAILPADTSSANPLEIGPFTLAPGATRIFDDVVGMFSSLPGVTTDFSKAAIKVRYSNTSDVPPVVMSRTFTDAPGGGTYGQFIPGVPVLSDTTKSPLWLTGLHDDGSGSEGYRTNVGITNLRADSLSNVTLTLLNPSGEAVTTKTFSLGPYEYSQKSVGSIFGSSYAAMGGLSLRMDLPSGADVQTYASEVDNQTGDPVLVTGSTAPTTALLMPGVAHNPGENGTVWRSDAEITNVDQQQHTWELTLYPTGGTTGASRNLTLGPGETADLTDLVGWLYGGSPPDVSGLVRVDATDNSGVMPIVRARTYNVTPNGNFGQNIPALAIGAGASATGENRHLLLTGMSSEDVARTNLGFVNLGSTTVNFAVTFYDQDGDVLNPDGQPYTVAVPANGWSQQKLETRFSNFFQTQLGANLEGISASIEVTTGSGFAYASVVDNITGDPIFVPAQPAP